MKNIILTLALLSVVITNAQQNKSPYEWNWVKDGIWLGAGFGGSAYGVILIKNKEGITMEKLNAIKKEDIGGINRWAAGYYSESASSIALVTFHLPYLLQHLSLFFLTMILIITQVNI